MGRAPSARSLRLHGTNSSRRLAAGEISASRPETIGEDEVPAGITNVLSGTAATARLSTSATHKNFLARMLCAASLYTIALCSSAHAQATSDTNPNAGTEVNSASTQLGEITVMARRREENIQNVPASITALSGASLEAASVQDVTDLEKVTPGLTYNPGTAGQVAEPALTIRALGAYVGNSFQDPPVALYFAEAPVNRQAGMIAALFDIDSVEVLKGPQGTLFGRSTTGGAIVVAPVRPGDTFGGYLETTFGDHGTRDFEGAVTIPITSTLSIRFSGLTENFDGDITNLFDGTKFNYKHDSFGRVGVLWTPNDKLQSYLVVDGLELNEGGIPDFNVLATPGEGLAAIVPAYVTESALQAQRAFDGGTTTSLNDPHGVHVTNVGATDITTYDLGSVTLKNVASVRQIFQVEQVDADGTDLDLVFARVPQNTTQYTEELQLSGKALGDKLTYVTGFDYFHERTFKLTDTLILGGAVVTYIGGTTTIDDYGGYGHVTYQFNPEVSMSAGARYTADDRTGLEFGHSAPGASGPCELLDANFNPLPAPCLRATQESSGTIDYMVDLDYKPSEAILLYLAQRRGTLAGGVNLEGITPLEAQPFAPEVVEDVEFGWKTTFSLAGMPTRVNGAVYYSFYTNLQEDIAFTRANLTPGSLVENAAAAQAKGLELDFVVKPTPSLTISGNTSIVDAHFTKYINPLTGQNFTNTPFDTLLPEYTARIAADWQLPFANEDIHFIPSYNWRSSTPFGGTNNAETAVFVTQGDQQPYGLLDLRLDWRNPVPRCSCELSVFSTNVLDEHYTVLGGYSPLQGSANRIYGDLRRVGASLKYRF